MVIFGQYPVNTIFFSMIIVEAHFITDDNKQNEANRNTCRQSYNIDDRVVFPSPKVSESRLNIIS